MWTGLAGKEESKSVHILSRFNKHDQSIHLSEVLRLSVTWL